MVACSLGARCKSASGHRWRQFITGHGHFQPRCDGVAYPLCQTSWPAVVVRSGRWSARISTLTPALSHQGRGSEIANPRIEYVVAMRDKSGYGCGWCSYCRRCCGAEYDRQATALYFAVRISERAHPTYGRRGTAPAFLRPPTPRSAHAHSPLWRVRCCGGRYGMTCLSFRRRNKAARRCCPL